MSIDGIITFDELKDLLVQKTNEATELIGKPFEQTRDERCIYAGQIKILMDLMLKITEENELIKEASSIVEKLNYIC